MRLQIHPQKKNYPTFRMRFFFNLILKIPRRKPLTNKRLSEINMTLILLSKELVHLSSGIKIMRTCCINISCSLSNQFMVCRKHQQLTKDTKRKRTKHIFELAFHPIRLFLNFLLKRTQRRKVIDEPLKCFFF